MPVVVALAVVLGVVVVAALTGERLRTGTSASAGAPDTPPAPRHAVPVPGSSLPGGRAGPGRAGRALMIAGLCVLAASLPLAFARNDAGCFDHCYAAHRWYVWNPAHNLGAPLLALGVVGSATRLRSTTATGCAVGPAIVAGWVGVAFTCLVAPGLVDEFLYGGPPAETLPTLWVAPAGWILLWAGAIDLPGKLHPAR